MPNCAHGFTESDCLICRALGTAPAPATTGGKTKVATSQQLDSLLAEKPGAPLPVARDGRATRPRSSTRLFLWKALGVVVVAGVLWLFFGGILNLAFHVVEYAFVALAAGWVGYEIGRLRGRRSH